MISEFVEILERKHREFIYDQAKDSIHLTAEGRQWLRTTIPEPIMKVGTIVVNIEFWKLKVNIKCWIWLTGHGLFSYIYITRMITLLYMSLYNMILIKIVQFQKGVRKWMLCFPRFSWRIKSSDKQAEPPLHPQPKDRLGCLARNRSTWGISISLNNLSQLNIPLLTITFLWTKCFIIILREVIPYLT